MTTKVLVTYATKLGSTAEVAQTIGETLSQQGASVDILLIQDVTEVSGYDVVIIGSAIRMGSWLPEAVNFVKRYKEKLNQVPTSIFSVHILNQEDTPESQKERQAYTAPIHEILNPRSETFFTGKIESDQLSFFERLLFKAVKSPSGDFRDWEAIQGWALDQA